MDYKWTIYKMITRERTEAVARELFPNDYIHPKYDCMDEPGRKGLPCRLCAAKRQEWRSIVGKTRLAMKQAFS
jgi:hypothetical protein